MEPYARFDTSREPHHHLAVKVLVESRAPILGDRYLGCFIIGTGVGVGSVSVSDRLTRYGANTFESSISVAWLGRIITFSS